MNWDRYLSVMERYAIKTDDMASEDAYFMATHMPFSQLEVYNWGRTSSEPELMTEDEVFEKLICNPENEHRMIIVRGDNGTGKSHLIRFLKAKMEMSPATIYNPATEQLIFLRRLNNSVRGVFSQLLEQKVIKDPDVEAKLRKFVDSSDSKDENSFKTDILYSYIAAVSNDQSGDVYKPVICRDIASYLSDSRIKEYLLREGGAISRCYSVITAPSSQVLKNTTIFTEEDFNVSKLIRAVIKQGDPQASDFATTLKGDEDEITRLVNYLNHFTREVVQRCADISSESTKTMFVQLRQDLKKQGKNLTLFIEDFTGFTGIDSELITVLSTSHEGNYYSDLCRVTSVIGITNDYYDQFRDNFTDRVRYQISVTDRAYGTESFLVQMAGRYLNAIYCDPDQLYSWNDEGADRANLPVSDFEPPCTWDSVVVEGKEISLYPFNKNALLRLYNSLPVKSPRMFLREVIRSQLKEFFDGKRYGEGWMFPLNPGNVQMSKETHGSAIDRREDISSEDKNRIKAILAIWGDGSAVGIRKPDGEIYFGGVNKAFFDDIDLAFFNGIGEIRDEKTGQSVSTETVSTKAAPINASNQNKEAVSASKRIDAATKNYLKYKEDINAWFDQDKPLQFDSDYRSWIRTFICGSQNQSGAINWQDSGVPAYVAEQRLNADLGYFYIEEQSTPINANRAIVVVDHSVESRDALLALNEYSYAGGWDFSEAVYYQQRLITWLERRKDEIIERVVGVKKSEEMLPVLEWCIAVQYLKACIYGKEINTSSTYTIIESLFSDFNKDTSIVRESKEWNDLIQYVENKRSEFDNSLAFLRGASATTMGAIHYSADKKMKSFYRADELVAAVEDLIAANWNIEGKIPESIPANHLLYNSAALLKSLYSRIEKVVDADDVLISAIKEKLTSLVGNLNNENLIETLSSVQEMYRVFGVNGITGSNELRTKYERSPIDVASEIMKCVRTLDSAHELPPVKRLAVYSRNSLHVLNEFLRDLQKIAHEAEREESAARNELKKIGVFEGIDQLSGEAKRALADLYDLVEEMEVQTNAAE